MAKKGLLIYILSAVIAGGSVFAMDMSDSFISPDFRAAADRAVNRPEFLIGYNFSSEAPAGFTLGIGRFYTSWNFFRYTLDDLWLGWLDEHEYLGVKFTFGYFFNLPSDFLRLPVGIGLCTMYGFVVEAGLS